MAELELDKESKEEIICKLQRYFETELNRELGSFEAEFLLDFFASNAGAYYYNQGLVDALKAFESKLEEFTDIVYQLEKPVSG